MLLLLIFILFISGIYLLHLNYNYWKRKGVPGPKPIFIVGNLLENFLCKKSIAELHAEIYKQFPDVPIVGIFKASTPTLILRDPDLIKEVTVKSFNHFHENELYIDKDVDPLVGRNPFFLRGDDWKKTRQYLTAAFTSGKMKSIYPLLETVAQDFVKYLEKHSASTKGLNAKEVSMRFTLNNVGSCAFGVDAKCFEEDNPEFKQIADRFLSPENFQIIKIFLISIMPIIAKFVSIKFTPKDVEEKISRLIEETLEYRQKNNVIRNDFLHIIHQVTKTDKNFTILDITAHAAGFFTDGYETSSIAFHFVLYYLAANPDKQSKLRDEVTQAFSNNKNTLPYEELQKLEYLDAVVNESLRLDPPAAVIARICTENYTYIPKENSAITKPVVIEKNTPIIIPINALQRDPLYFEDPDNFKPERFLGGIKENAKYKFSPFGEGPRACLGQRFGILQIKIGIAYVIHNFAISVNHKTVEPIKYDPLYFLTLPKNPIILNFEKISQ